MLPPAQILVAVALIATEGVTLGLTVIFNVLEVAVTGDAQVALLVSTTLIASLLAKPVVVNVLLLVPTLLPFSFHW